MPHSAPAPTQHIGASLRRWRVLNNVKQAAAAAELGVSQTTVSRWEKGFLHPDGRDRRKLMELLAARPTSAADRALLELVTSSARPVHLVCDLTHRLLAVSPARASEWREDVAGFLRTSLWPFASQGIVAGEAKLADWGWYEPTAPDVTIVTERAVFPELAIAAGEIVWSRIPLSDGRFARLVRDGARAGHA